MQGNRIRELWLLAEVIQLVSDNVGIQTRPFLLRKVQVPNDVSISLLCVCSYPAWWGNGVWSVAEDCKIRILMQFLKAE